MQHHRHILIEYPLSVPMEGVLNNLPSPEQRSFGLLLGLPITEDSLTGGETNEMAMSLEGVLEAFDSLPIALERSGLKKVVCYRPSSPDIYGYLDTILSSRGISGVYYHPCTSPWVARWVRNWYSSKVIISGYDDESTLLSIANLHAEGIRHFILHDRKLIKSLIKDLHKQAQSIEPVFNMEVLLRLARQEGNERVDWQVMEDIMDQLLEGWPNVRSVGL